MRSIGKNRVEWQEIPFDSSEAHEIPALEEVDRLRELALTTLRERESESLGNVLKKRPRPIRDEALSGFLEIR